MSINITYRRTCLNESDNDMMSLQTIYATDGVSSIEFKIANYPTYNCQLRTLAQGYVLASASKEFKLAILNFLNTSHISFDAIDDKGYIVRANTLLFDLKKSYDNINGMLDFGEEATLLNAPYISSNGSNMIIYIIHVQKAIEHLEKLLKK